MRRLKLELKQRMDKYSTACKEALTAKQKASELHHWKLTEERKFEEAKHSEEVALAIAEKERARSKIAMETAEAANRIAELESQKRVNAKIRALKEAAQAREVLDNLAQSDLKYKRYTIEEIDKATNFFVEFQKIGEGGYGPVYRCYLDHTPVTVKVLRPDAAHGRSQFQQEACMWIDDDQDNESGQEINGKDYAVKVYKIEDISDEDGTKHKDLSKKKIGPSMRRMKKWNRQ